jgi:hypothetical protein
MKKYFMPKLFLLIPLLIGIISTSQAQDSVKKTVVKKAIVHTAVKPGTVVPAAGKPSIPINPKTGRPYTHYGYGYYSKNKYDAHKADSLKKAAALKVATPVATPATPPAVADTTPAVAAVAPVDKSLNGQYQYLLTKLYRNQQPFADALWKNFMDTLTRTRNQLKDTTAKLTSQNKTLSNLQVSANRDQNTSDSISFFGADVSKSTYNIIMWGLVIVIGIVAGIVLAQSGGYRKEAIHRTQLYSELEEEFKTYKSKANEKEKKLARELQTERNKLDELQGRG